MADDFQIDKEEFLKFQNDKFRVRRRLAVGTTIAYFAIIVYMLYKYVPDDFDKMDGFFTQISIFAAGIVLGYFGGASYEETRIDRRQLVEEFTALKKPKRNTTQDQFQNQQNEDEVG